MLLDAYKSATEIDTLVAEVDFDSYSNQRILRLAMERLFEIVGEALTQAAKTDSSLVNRLPHARDAINMRNWISHGYNDISDSVVWATVVDDIPVLRMGMETRQLLEHTGQWPDWVLML